MKKPKIEIESTELARDRYLVTVFATLPKTGKTEELENIEWFYKRAKKMLELKCSIVISEMLSVYGVKQHNNKCVLEWLKTHNKRIFIDNARMESQLLFQDDENMLLQDEDTILIRKTISIKDYKYA